MGSIGARGRRTMTSDRPGHVRASTGDSIPSGTEIRSLPDAARTSILESYGRILAIEVAQPEVPMSKRNNMNPDHYVGRGRDRNSTGSTIRFRSSSSVRHRPPRTGAPRTSFSRCARRRARRAKKTSAVTSSPERRRFRLRSATIPQRQSAYSLFEVQVCPTSTSSSSFSSNSGHPCRLPRCRWSDASSARPRSSARWLRAW